MRCEEISFILFSDREQSVWNLLTDLPQTSRSLPIVLIRARENVMAPIRKMLLKSGITEQQWRVLRVLSEVGPVDSSTLAERASIPFPSLTRIAHSMAERGLISQRRDTRDRRRQTVSITDDGAQIIADNMAEATRIVARFKEHLGADNYETLLDLLTALDGLDANQTD